MPRASSRSLPAVLLCLALSATVACAAPRSIGLIMDAGPAAHRVPFVRFADVLLETLASSRQWEPTALSADSPIVRVTGATWPLPTRDNWMTVAEVLQSLLLATELDDVVVVRPMPAVTNDLEIFWLRQGEKDIRRLHVSEPGSGDQAYAALARRVLTALEEGFAKAPLAERFALQPGPAPQTPATPPATPPTPPATTPPTPPATTPPTPPATTPPTPPATTPAAPATPLAPATGAAVGVGAHETPPATAATAPVTTPGTAAELPKPGATAARPGGEPAKPEVPTAQPATEPVGPQAPATAPAAPVTPPATAPATPATPPATTPATPATPPATAPATPTTPPAATPPAATPAQPREPSAFLPAAQKYLKEGDFKRVEEMLLKAQDAGDPRAQVYAMWADLEKARQNVSAERTWLQRALAEDDTLTPAHLRLAELLRQAGLWRKAADEYEVVMKREPRNLYAYTGLSALYASQSQPRRAAEILTQALQFAPQDSSLYLRIGDLHAQRQAWAEAENAYDRAARLTQGAGRAEALDRLGDLYLQAGRGREGFICYAEASKLRAGGASTMAEKRYGQIMAVADKTLLEGCARTQASFEAYLTGQSVYREEVWAALNDFRQQVQDILGSVSSTVPPATLKAVHLQRKLAYSLAVEASLAGLDYVDQGAAKAQRLQDYRRLLDEATSTIQKL